MVGIIYFVAVCLLALGGVAGLALFFRAIAGQGKEAPWGVRTLWGLFIVCTVAGIIIVSVLYGNHLVER